MKYAIVSDGKVVSIGEADDRPDGAVALTDEDYTAIAADISCAWSWDGDAATKVAVPFSLDAAKAAKNAEINESRLAATFSTFTHDDKVFACDRLSRSDIDGTNGTMTLTGGFPPDWPGGWKAVDNTYIPITTRAHWEAFYLSMSATGTANFVHAQGLKAQVDAATTAEQVAAIVW